MKAILLGIAASFFFTSTFILNRSMNLGGGSWIWSAVLRYLFMVLPLLLIVLLRGNLRPLLAAMRARPWAWLVWSTVGFGVFYAPLCFAAAYQPAWLVAGTWQTTIVFGSLLAPLFLTTVMTSRGPQQVRGTVPLRGVGISLIILLGVLVIQFEHAATVSVQQLVYGFVPVLVAAVAYPLGNRKMMALYGNQLDTFQRVLGMTIASLPFWFALGAYGLATVDAPSQSQIVQSAMVALLAGVVATLLFFKATDLAHGDAHQLAAVEATQAGEVVLALVGEILLFGSALPSPLALVGMAAIIGGMVAHSFASRGSASAPLAVDEPVQPAA